MNKRVLLPVMLPLLLALVVAITKIDASAQTESLTDQELAEKFAPVLYFHAAEIFRPQQVEVLLDTARLRQERSFWFDANVSNRVSTSKLNNYREDTFFIDAWYGSGWASDSNNYSSHRAYYQALLSPQGGGFPVVTFAHVVRAENLDHIVIQYWLFYYYNDWFNKHEGDWEMVQVMLNAQGEPKWAVYSQHHGGTRREWEDVKIEAGTHPAVYVALGSHANYFWGNEVYPTVQDIGNMSIEVVDHTGDAGRIIPQVILIPNTEYIEIDPLSWSGVSWLLFGGHWGETAEHKDFAGPVGPAYKGEQWERPYVWGMAQPLDTEVWYSNRLRVEVSGAAAQDTHVHLKAANGKEISEAEMPGHFALLHKDANPQEEIIADIELPRKSPYNLFVTWPDMEALRVNHFSFTDLPLSLSGHISLTLSGEHLPLLNVDGLTYELQPAENQTEPLSGFPPDWVWMAGSLSTSDLVKGIGFGLFGAILPAWLYVTLLYWSDYYEREPKHLVAAAFLWGALPALMLAVIMRIFYRLPPGLFSPSATKIVWFVLLSPLIEEILKGIAVIFLAFRYRREFDDVLDGIIYGAMVGVGFAMTGNIISYIGSFLTRGFAGLGSTILVEGVLYSLDHALYSAIFGAGLGFYRLSQDRFRRSAVAFGALSLAVVTHGLHNLVIQNAMTLNLAMILLTWSGVFVLVIAMIWSLRRQRRCLEVELIEEMPRAIYDSMIRPWVRLRTEWRVLRSEGIAAWRVRRRLHQLCAEFAFKRMQARLFPDEVEINAEADALRDEIWGLIKKFGD